MSGLPAAPRGRDLPPVRARGPWVAWGLALQATGVGIPVLAALVREHEASVGGAVTHYTIRLIWHEMLHSRSDVALIILGVVLFAAGAVVLARPFVRRSSTLMLAVPLAAVAGLAVFGVVALIIAAVIAAAAASGSGDWADVASNLIDWPRSRRRR
jgi:hypothetical protein